VLLSSQCVALILSYPCPILVPIAPEHQSIKSLFLQMRRRAIHVPHVRSSYWRPCIRAPNSWQGAHRPIVRTTPSPISCIPQNNLSALVTSPKSSCQFSAIRDLLPVLIVVWLPYIQRLGLKRRFHRVSLNWARSNGCSAHAIVRHATIWPPRRAPANAVVIW
jgi:hypothetical protein